VLASRQKIDQKQEGPRVSGARDPLSSRRMSLLWIETRPKALVEQQNTST
jgi:hypothetical protein